MTPYGRAAALALAAALLAPAGARSQGAGVPPEPALRQELQDARWPADIAAIADRYLAAYPQGPAAAGARTERERARNTRRLLERSDIRLFRGDFLVRGAAASFQDDVRRAALADKDAALRIARAHLGGEAGLEASVSRYVGWLQYAAALGSGPGSYELALHYRKDNQPALAAPYEARAEELGFQAPPSLDHVRK